MSNFFLNRAAACLPCGVALLTVWMFVCVSTFAQPLRWQEYAYGISLTPPEGTLQFEKNPEVSWRHPDGYSISFEILTSEQHMDLNSVGTATLVQMGFAQAMPRLISPDGQGSAPRQQRIAEQPGIKMYFDIQEDDKPDWLYAQAIVMLEPYAAAVIKLTAEKDQSEAGQAAFEAVLDSLNVPLAHELEEMRNPLVEAGDAWLSNLTKDDLLAALPRDAWYRHEFRGKDHGYTRIRSTADPQDLRHKNHEPPGVLVLIDHRQYVDKQVLDTETTLYLADDGQREIWSTKKSLRTSKQAREGSTKSKLPQNTRERPATWSESGVRGDQFQRGKPINVLTVITESPTDPNIVRQVEHHETLNKQLKNNEVRGQADVSEWVVPDKAYLSQVHVLALAKLLPPEEKTYCFSAYHPATGKPGLRIVEVFPQDDGGLLVLDRPNSRNSPTSWVFDAERNLVQSVSPIGVVTRPATIEELKAMAGLNSN